MLKPVLGLTAAGMLGILLWKLLGILLLPLAGIALAFLISVFKVVMVVGLVLIAMWILRRLNRSEVSV